MIKVICTSVARLPAQLAEGERAFTYFKSARREGVGTIAQSWHGSLKRKGFRPTQAAWDFVQFCLAVCATDLCAMRSTSADGWTRTIELSVGLHEPLRWDPWKVELEHLLRVLTGDYWTLIFTDAGLPPLKDASPPRIKIAFPCYLVVSTALSVAWISWLGVGGLCLFLSWLTRTLSASVAMQPC
ncbi:Uncharacterised protein [Stutzerimonas stutzeri]|uniref:hypothetical protein n=1 Tax=Stutzerimonas stutzeri TaxID=316 RepID=UPI000F71B6AF|nr:hypothetical protein [Stutzerimonas stutzeri]VEI37128.1 Uncharacterised protein [Stutzerimonas stutzeri]